MGLALHLPVAACSREKLDGTREERTRGTPQGGVVSPLLANLFMHYAFDVWMRRTFPRVQFERYADDAVVHCVSEAQARYVLSAIRERLAECGLELHPIKTKIVYCKDDDRRGDYDKVSFDFLGYTFPGELGNPLYGNVQLILFSGLKRFYQSVFIQIIFEKFTNG